MENTMKNIKPVIGTEEYEICGETVEIKKVSMGTIKAMQVKLQKITAKGEDEENIQDVMFLIIRSMVVDADTMTDKELMEFPMQELKDLMNKCLQVNGMGQVEGND